MSQPTPRKKNFLVPRIASQILSTLYGSSTYHRERETTAFSLSLQPDVALRGIYSHDSLNSPLNPSQASTAGVSAGCGWFAPTHTLGAFMDQIQQGIIPDLIELVCSFPVDVDPVDAQQQLRQYCYVLSQAGPLGRLRGQELRLALGFRSRKAQYKYLQVVEQTAHPTQQQHIQYQKNALLILMDELENALIDQLSEDPCLGKEIFLNKEQKAYPCWIQKLLRGFRGVLKRMVGPT
ncbi:hypothetical protein [Vampirovibrio chlorellavorus]|uniref:hypothetical protein n=1 Tax=Vampirovibrio chlorellavorus TaxID=758823 RepID=UPI0026F07156|nr:hypothetical protein [Vampirovibrio chlorellavorus]